MLLPSLAVVCVLSNEIADFLPARALSKTDPGNIREVDWASVDTVNIARMTADDVKLLTFCQNIPADLVSRIPSKAVFALDAACLASMPPDVFAALKPDQLVQLSSAVSGSLKSAQVAALPVASCASFASSDLFKHATIELCAGISAECVKAIPALSRASLKAPSCYQHTASQEVKAVLDATASLPDNLPEQRGVVKLAAAVPAAPAGVVTEDVLKAMLTCETLTASQMSRIDAKVFSHMTVPCMRSITPEAFAGINAAQLAPIPKEVILHITDAQVAAMDTRTCALFATTDSFEYLSVSICGVLSEGCVRAAFAAIRESPECVAKIRFNVTALSRSVQLNRISDLLPSVSQQDMLSGHVDWKVVPASAFAQLNGDDLKLLVNCTSLSGEQLSRVVPEVLVDLPASCVETLAPEAFAQLNIRQLFGLGASVVTKISAQQIAALPAERCAAFAESDTFDTLMSACGGISVACVTHMRQKDIEKVAARIPCKTAMGEAVKTAVSAMVSNPPAAVLLGLAALPADCANLTLEQIPSLAADVFALIKAECLAAIPAAVFAGLPVDKLNSIPQALLASAATAAQMAALTPPQCKQILAERDGFLFALDVANDACPLVFCNCSAVSAASIRAIKVGLLKSIPAPCFKTLSEAAITAFSPDQINHLSMEHSLAATPKQMGWLTTEQCSGMNGGDFVKYQSGTACSGLTTACVKALPLEAFKYLAGRLNCFNHLTPEVRSSIPASVVARLSLRMLETKEIVSLGFCDLLTAVQINSLGVAIQGVSAACFSAITPEAFGAVAGQIRELPTALTTSISREQAASITPAQCAAFDGSTAFKEISPEACAGFSAECLTAMPLEAFDAVVSRRACLARIPKEVRAKLTLQQTAKLQTAELAVAAPVVEPVERGEKVDLRRTSSSYSFLAGMEDFFF